MPNHVSRYDYMTLSELIADVAERRNLSYEGLAACAKRRGVNVTGPYLCKLVREPLIGLRENTLKMVSAATGIEESIVAAAAMRSWGYHLYRASHAGHETVVMSTAGPLTVEEVAEAVIAHDQVVRDIHESEVSPDRDTSTAIVPGSATTPLDNGLPHQRTQPRANHGGRARHVTASPPQPG